MEEGKTTKFMSIDQARGHLTLDLLGHTLRQLSKRDKGASYRSDQRSFKSRSDLATPRENRDNIDEETSKQQTHKFIHQPAGNNIHCTG